MLIYSLDNNKKWPGSYYYASFSLGGKIIFWRIISDKKELKTLYETILVIMSQDRDNQESIRSFQNRINW